MQRNKLINLFSLIIITLFMGFSCFPIDYFSDYQGVNLISNYPFSSTSWSLVNSSVTSPNYMAWEPSSAPNPTVEPDSSSAYQLEIKNLLPNGDFETGNFNVNIWQETGGSAGNLQVVSTALPPDQYIINNHTLFFKAMSAGQALQFDIDTALGSPVLARGVYRITADMIVPSSHFTLLKTDARDSNLSFFLSSPVGSSSFSLNTVLQSDSKNNLYNFLGFDINSLPSTITLQFGDSMTELPVFSLDNVSLVRDDLVMAVQLSLPSINSGTKTLIPASSVGAYKLSLYVMDDSNAGGNNHFYASGVSIIVSASVQPNFPGTYSQFFPRPATGWGTWTRLELLLGFNFAQNGSSPALTIQISPTNMLDISTGGVRCGSVLVSSPSFMFTGGS